jgi:hypothetical protein
MKELLFVITMACAATVQAFSIWDLIWLIVDRTEAKESELFVPRSFLLRYNLRPKKSCYAFAMHTYTRDTSKLSSYCVL